ncbi:MAG: hypothetical protein IPJ34_17210 [Myxococcales bacterium]|nr:hypothetical protein [Myxococcales bacterium]
MSPLFGTLNQRLAALRTSAMRTIISAVFAALPDVLDSDWHSQGLLDPKFGLCPLCPCRLANKLDASLQVRVSGSSISCWEARTPVPATVTASRTSLAAV